MEWTVNFSSPPKTTLLPCIISRLDAESARLGSSLAKFRTTLLSSLVIQTPLAVQTMSATILRPQLGSMSTVSSANLHHTIANGASAGEQMELVALSRRLAQHNKHDFDHLCSLLDAEGLRVEDIKDRRGLEFRSDVVRSYRTEPLPFSHRQSHRRVSQSQLNRRLPTVQEHQPVHVEEPQSPVSEELDNHSHDQCMDIPTPVLDKMRLVQNALADFNRSTRRRSSQSSRPSGEEPHPRRQEQMLSADLYYHALGFQAALEVEKSYSMVCSVHILHSGLRLASAACSLRISPFLFAVIYIRI